MKPWCCHLTQPGDVGCEETPVFEVKGTHFEDQTMTCVAHLSGMVRPSDTVHLIGHEQSVEEMVAA